ncbi:MAG TPA: ribonuclease P protein component [Ignavibacteriales bacterium]|nr:ribonuclease P protein component [Ignavibacteriales bacterium]
MKKFGLSKSERIKKETDFRQVYSVGKVIYSDDQKLKVSYFPEKNSEQAGIKIAAAVSKKAGNAVWRNRVKRLLRESYRLNKEILTANCSEKAICLKIIFSPNNLNQKKQKKLRLDDIRPAVIDLMNKINSRL